MTNAINSNEQMIEKINEVLQNKKDAVVNIVNSWYDSNRMELLYAYYKKLVDTRGMLKKAVSNAERMSLNKEIKKAIQTLDDANAT